MISASKPITPIEELTKLNQALFNKRPKVARHVTPSKDMERFYRVQLKSLISEIRKQINKKVMPVIKQEKTAYLADGITFKDGYAESLLLAIEDVRLFFLGEDVNNKIATLSSGVVSDTEFYANEAFNKQINKAVGVDYAGQLVKEDLTDYLAISTAENTTLIKSLRDDYLKNAQTAITEGIRNGSHPSAIAKALTNQYGIAESRAKLIARDQWAKINGDIVKKRQESAGIKLFRWSTSKDIAVTGNPAGKYPKAKIKCYDIARKETEYGKGIYSWDEGAKFAGESNLFPSRAHIGCRCVAIPVFPWQLDK